MTRRSPSDSTRPRWPLVALAVAALLAGCTNESKPAAGEARAKSADSSAGPRLKWAEVESAEKATVARLPAEVVVPEHARVELGLPVDAEIRQWRVGPGDRVEAGETIAVVSSPELSDLRAEIERHSAVLARRKSFADRQRDYVDRGIQPARVLRQAELAVTEARSRLQAARRRVQARTGEWLSARSGGDFAWKASAGGEVAEVLCATGRLRPAGRGCLRLTASRRGFVRLRVPQRLSARLDESTRVDWRPFGKSRLEEPTRLRFERRAAALSAKTHTRAYYFRPAGDEAAGGELTVGEAGVATVQLPAGEGAVLVPRLAVTHIDNQPHVFTEGEGGEPTPRRVEIRAQHGTDYLVDSRRLSPGDRVVSSGVFRLKSQQLLN